MIYFKKRPACRAAISLAAGIIVTYYLPSIVILAFFLLCLLFLIFFSKNKDIKLIILMIMLGIILLGSKEIIYNHSIPQKYWNKNKIVNLKGIIREDLQAIDDNKLFLKVKDINGEKIYAAKLEIDKRYLTKDFVDGDLIYGNFILNRGNEQRNPGGFSYRTYLKKNGLLGTAYPVKIIKHDHNYKLNIGTHLIRLKKSLIQIIDQNCSSPLQGIYKALILGERASLPDNWSTSFEKAGASHLLAISGLHLGFIVILLNLIGKILIIPNKYWNILISIIILVYILITGGRASVFRAGTLTLLFLWAPFINRKADTFNILGFSVIILLIINPYNLFMVGFQLTYIILMVILIYHKIFSKWLGKILAVSTAAQLGSIPLTAYYFNIITPIGIITNIWAIPLIGFILLITFPALFLGLIFPDIFNFVTIITDQILYIIKLGLDFSAKPFFSHFETASPAVMFIILYYCCLLSYPFFKKRRVLYVNRKKTGKLENLFKILILFFILIYIINSFISTNKLKITFFDVGQGDAILLELPDDYNILIDGGGMAGYKSSTGEKIILPYLIKKGIKNIDLGVITHFDVDHALGIIDLLKEKRIKSLMIPYIYTDNHLSSEVFAIAKKNKIPINIAGDGTRININDIVINILYPPDKPYYYRKNNNSNSIVMMINYHNFSILLTGDIEREGEKKLLEKNYNLESIILKLAHHGSKTSSTQEFIKKSNPREAVISVGKNNYGHPDPEVLERIEKMGIRYWITEENGAVIIETNGQEYSIKSFMEN